MKLRANLMNEDEMMRALKRMAHQIAEKNKGGANIALLGIRRRGVPLAHILAKNLLSIEGVQPPVGILDITFYRDDLQKETSAPIVNMTDVQFDVTGKDVVLVDDVLFTGRTARAALEATMALGRPDTVQLAVLIDRGHRELPIRADYVGKNVPTSKGEIVSVCIHEYDGKTCVNLYMDEK